MANEIELPADLRAKIERMGREVEVEGMIYLGNSPAVREARNLALRAAALAVEHERELVCSICGSRITNGMHPPDVVASCIVRPWETITRAQYEFERRKEQP